MGKIIHCLSTTFWEHSSGRTLKLIHDEKAAFISHTPLLFPTMYYMTSTNISNFLRLTKQGQGSVFFVGGGLCLFCFVLFWRWLLPLSEQNVIGIRQWCWMMLSAVLCCIYTLFWRSYRVELNQNTPVPNTCTLLPTCPHWNCFKSQCRTGCFIYILFILELALNSRDDVSFHKFGLFLPIWMK